MAKARRELTNEQKEKLVSMYKTGEYSVADIAKHFSVGTTTVNRIINPKYYALDRKSSSRYYQENKKELQKKEKETYTRVSLKLNNKNDKDIIDKFASEPNVQGYLKTLIRADIASNTKE